MILLIIPDKFKQLYNENLVYVIHSRAADLHQVKVIMKLLIEINYQNKN